MAVVKRFALDGITYDIEPTNIDAVPTEGSNNAVSSSGVKSYVDSNYVPLSATQAPVTGLTDILTPVNLLPNSDFSRSGGYPATQSWEALASGKVTYVCYGWAFHFIKAASNITVTKNTNSLNIQGVLSASDGDTANGGCLIIRNMYTLSLNNPYTLGVTITDNIGTLVKAGIFGLGSTEEVYRKPWSSSDNKTVAVMIKSISDVQPGFIIVFNEGTNISFNITISDCFIYDGEFKNPPVTTSLDVKPENQFALSDGSNIHIGSTDILSSVNKSIYEKSGNIRLDFDVKNNTLGNNVQVPIFYDYLNYAWKAMSVYLRIKFDEYGTYGRTYSRYYDAYYFIASNNPASGTQYEVKTITPGILQSIASSIDGGETTVGLRKLKRNNTNHETAILLTLSNIVYRSSGGIAINIDYQLFTQSGLNTTYIYSSFNWLSL